ncbi:MAG: hypothetical protein O3A70_05880, partial [Bacteroidetes bacterium]|nr:hypothetical protein [Bacteroidota bacterium]
MLCHLRAFIRLLSFTLIMTAMSIAVPLARVLGGAQFAFNVHRKGMFIVHKVLGIKLNIIGELPTTP